MTDLQKAQAAYDYFKTPDALWQLNLLTCNYCSKEAQWDMSLSGKAYRVCTEHRMAAYRDAMKRQGRNA